MSDSSVNQRIAQMVEYFHKGNKSAFAKAVGISNQSLGEIVGSRKSAPSFAALQKILLAFPQVRIEWLVLGGGEMRVDALLSQSTDEVDRVTAPQKRHVPTGASREELETLRNQVEKEYIMSMRNYDVISDFLMAIRQRLSQLDL